MKKKINATARIKVTPKIKRDIKIEAAKIGLTEGELVAEAFRYWRVNTV